MNSKREELEKFRKFKGPIIDVRSPSEYYYPLARMLSETKRMKKTFKLKDIDPMVFSGAGDKNIKVIESHFNSTIVLRGNNLIVDGLKKEINDIELLVENITYTINNKGFIDIPLK